MENLHTYLRDHLAGSVGAVELLDRLIDTSQEPAFTVFFTTLREDIVADKSVLEELLQQVGGEESLVRNAGAWMLEKLSRVKLQAGQENRLGLFQALETLALGIAGKRALWRNLAAAAARGENWPTLDFPLLEGRATEQFKRVEGKCLELAPAVLNWTD
jgi:hypothetical protein